MNFIFYFSSKSWLNSFCPDFIQIWSSFQSQSLERLRKHSPDDLEAIIWTSTLTDTEFIDNLPKEDYTIQIWTDSTVSKLYVTVNCNKKNHLLLIMAELICFINDMCVKINQLLLFQKIELLVVIIAHHFFVILIHLLFLQGMWSTVLEICSNWFCLN